MVLLARRLFVAENLRYAPARVARGDVYRFGAWMDTLLISSSESPQATRDTRSAEDFRLSRRAAALIRMRVDANDADTLRWLRETVDPSWSAAETDLRVPDGMALSTPNRPELLTLDRWMRRLESALEDGLLEVELEPRVPLPDPPETPRPDFPSPPSLPSDATDTLFDVRYVDEIGVAINGLDVEVDTGGDPHPVTTNAGGVALLEQVVATGATVSVTDASALEKILDPRWAKFRPGKPPKQSNTIEFLFDGVTIDSVDVKPAVPYTVVIKPPLGALFVELWDKTGRVRHADRDFTIDGPMPFSGTTDDQGRFSFADVFPGDYTLTLMLTFFDGDDQQTDTYTSQLVVLDPGEGEPEVRLIGAVPRVVLARLRMLFNTNKAFLLPTAFPSVRALGELYRDNDPSHLVVVGHTDAAGDPDFNDQLALDRANAVVAFLKRDVDTWLAFYDSSAPAEKRWGKPEDRMMLVSMPDFPTKPKGDDAVSWFQQTRGLSVDGIAGPDTRRQLITEYLALDGVSLEDAGIQIDAVAHGCGANFPLDAGGTPDSDGDASTSDGDASTSDGDASTSDGDASTSDGPPPSSAATAPKSNPLNRRVELFFFDPEFGVVPAPAGDTSDASSTDYPAWLKNAVEIHDFDADEMVGPSILFVEVADELFRTNSSVVLPEGEAPSGDAAQQSALTSIGAFASALRFNDENPGKRVLVAGHTDTEGASDFNQTLSNERANCALACLMGDRDAFKTICDGRHTVSDIKQILAWVARAFPDLAFDCDPGAIDDDADSAVDPTRRFQTAYNQNKSALGATADDLNADGDVGPLTWGAIFDCYEFSLQQELGVGADGLTALRAEIIFVDDDRKALGFGENFPVDELGVDNYRSQASRRAEILFFDADEVPDTEAAQNDPETSEIYLPGGYVREPIDDGSAGGAGEYVIATDIYVTELDDKDFDVVFTLSSMRGRRVVRGARLNGENNGGQIDVRFSNISVSDAYSLAVSYGGDDATVVFEAVPYDQLAGAALPEGQLIAATDSTEAQPADPVATA
jgi:outer membrane protein OmpA-like peptidoglycan-associated protein